jgi:hypothetical protein
MDWMFWLSVAEKVGMPIFNKMVELASPKIPTIDQIKAQSVALWAKIAEEQAKP